MSELHSIECEQSLIGSILLQNNLFPLIADKVKAADYFEPIHGELHSICASLINMGKRANPMTVTPFLPADLKIGEMNAKQYVARLAAAGAIPNEIVQLAEMVRDLSDRRAMAGVASELGKAQGGDPGELAGWAIEQLDGIVAARMITGVPSLTLGASVVRAVDSIAKAYQSDGALTGMSFGLKDLDRKTSGLSKGELTILAGRPGMFKTGLALNFSRSLCWAGHAGIFFSLEMGDVSLSRRLLSDMIFDRREVPHFRMKSGRVTEEDFTAITDAGRLMAELPLRIEQQTGLTISTIAARTRQAKRKNGLDFIIVDHMGHIVASDRYAGSKVNEIGETSAGLLRLARELDIAVIALCQLSRGVESRDNKRPTISDLRDSGNIEQDAATVLLLYREAYYLQNAEPKVGTPEYEMWLIKMEACLHDLEIVIGKQRDGGTGSVRAYVDVACNAVRETGWTRDVYADERERFAF